MSFQLSAVCTQLNSRKFASSHPIRNDVTN